MVGFIIWLSPIREENAEKEREKYEGKNKIAIKDDKRRFALLYIVFLFFYFSMHNVILFVR